MFPFFFEFENIKNVLDGMDALQVIHRARLGQNL
jgi:hypothetical protein